MSERWGDWEPVIGLEVHVQLSTASKIFSGASTAFGAAPNSQACAVDLGLPGVLPVINRDAVRKALVFGLAIGAAFAFVSALLALVLMMRLLKSVSFTPYVVYRVVLGVVLLWWGYS